VAQIIQICKLTNKLTQFLAAGIFAVSASPYAIASNKSNTAVDDYVAARLAEISQNSQSAQIKYAKLLTYAPSSGTVADRLYSSAIRSGNMANAVKAVRAQELQNATTSEGPLILFADAFRRKDWAMAKLASKEISAKTYYGFMTPILDAWLNTAQNQPTNMSGEDAKDQAFAYFAVSQRIYLKLANRQFISAKSDIKSLQSINIDFVRSMNIRLAPVFALNGDKQFAASLISTAVDSDAQNPIAYPKTAMRFTPNDGLAALHVHIAISLLEQKQPEQALVFARIAEYYLPGDIETRLTLGKLLLAVGAEKQGQVQLAAVPLSSPYWSEAVTASAREYSAKKNIAAARALILDARKKQPLSVVIALLAAQIFEDSKDLASAAKIYDDLLKSADLSKNASSQAAVYRMFLANVAEKQGDWQKAIELLDAARALDASNPYILNSLGYLMLEHGDSPSRALEILKKARALAPDSAAITDSLGWAYVQIGDLSQALPLLELAAKREGSDITINEHLGDAYWKAGRRVDARYAWKIALHVAGSKDVTEAGIAERLRKKIDQGLTATIPIKKL
jgi:tetratricopeptide (TPR) repeat protein